MSKTTRATQALEKLGVTFTLHSYDYDPDADSIGLQAAQALGVAPKCMLKTLMAEVDGKAVCAVVPSDREISMKKLASTFGGKAAKMMRPADAERLTGYHVGGISPFGQKKRVPVAIEESALGEAKVFVNGGIGACREAVTFLFVGRIGRDRRLQDFHQCIAFRCEVGGERERFDARRRNVFRLAVLQFSSSDCSIGPLAATVKCRKMRPRVWLT